MSTITEINGKNYFLTSIDTPNSPHYLLIDDKPVCSVDLINKTTKDAPIMSVNSLDIAEICIKSFKDNNGMYSINPSSYFSFFNRSDTEKAPEGFYQKQLDNSSVDFDTLDYTNVRVDPYIIFGIRHLHLEILDSNLRVNIWDKDLIRKVAGKFNEAQKQKRFNRLLDEDSGFGQLLANL
jgi:hypothetical protein